MKRWADDTLGKYLYKTRCKKCKQLITFYKPYSCICANCNTRVYPSKEIEFKEKLAIERRKNKYECCNT